jgi:hypothetical protein
MPYDLVVGAGQLLGPSFTVSFWILPVKRNGTW